MRGLDIYADLLESTGNEYDAWVNFTKSNIAPEDFEVVSKILDRQNLLENFEHGTEPAPFEYRRLGNDGKYHWIRLVARIFKDTQTGDVLVFGYAFDIEEEKREKQELLQRAQTDLFTGLYNKVTTEALIGKAIRSGSGILLLLDVDNLKKINDRLGHEVGDRVLKYVASVIKSCSRSNDILGRIGGDEFMIYLLDMGNIAAAERRAAEILSLLAKGTDCKGRKQTITASIGIAPIDGTVNSFSDAYNRADLALYQVKHRKKNGYAVYGETGPGESPAPQ